MNKRPLSSFEIQSQHGRMPTRDERRAFSHWRNENPAVCLECGYTYDHPGTPDCTTHNERRKRAEVENDEWRYNPEAAHMRVLSNAIGDDAAQAIKALVEFMIHEALHPRNEE